MGSLAGHVILQVAFSAVLCMHYSKQASEQFNCSLGRNYWSSQLQHTIETFPYTINLTAADKLSGSNYYCWEIKYDLTAKSIHGLIDNPFLLARIHSESPILGDMDEPNLKMINDRYNIRVFLLHENVGANRIYGERLLERLNIICRDFKNYFDFIIIHTISFELTIPRFTMPGPNLVLLTPDGGGLALQTRNESVDSSMWKFHLEVNSEASRRVPQLSFRASNRDKQTGAANDSYKLLDVNAWAPNSLKGCVCGSMTGYKCRQAVSINCSGTQVAVTFRPALLSGNECREIYVELILVDTCSQHLDCDGYTLVKLILGLSNATGVGPAYLAYICSALSYYYSLLCTIYG